jgi:chromatin remodeling complex protein RSC6
MARTEVSKLIHEYVKKENLQKEGNRRVIRPDNKLQKLLVIDATKEELTYFNLQKYLKKHFRKEVV